MRAGRASEWPACGTFHIKEYEMDLTIGTKGTCQMTVGEADTALAHGSGTLQVLATPAMAALMERTAWQSIADQLPEGSTTVGTSLQLSHRAPTPVGATVTCESELVAQDRRSLTIEVAVFDEAGQVGKATHQRFIVDAEPFFAKAQGRKA